MTVGRGKRAEDRSKIEVSADLSYLLNPHQLLTLIAGLRSGIYSRAYLPDVISRIGLMGYPLGPKSSPFEFDLFASDQPFSIGFAKETGQGKAILSDNFDAALQLLQRAHKEGLFEIVETAKYAQIGRAAFTINKPMSSMLEYHWPRPQGGQLLIGPMSGEEIHALLGLYEEKGILPLFSDRSALKMDLAWDLPVIFGHEQEEHAGMKALIDCPIAADIDELYFYAQNSKIVEAISSKLVSTKLRRTRPAEIALIASKFAGTFALDIAFFGGLPISTGMVAVYDMTRRYFL